MSEAVRVLAADRDRLLARLNTLERSLEDVTGSIPPGATRTPQGGRARRCPCVAAPLPAPTASTPRRAGASSPEPRCRRPPRDRQPGGLRSRSRPRPSSASTRRQRLDRRTAHAVDDAEDQPAGAARGLAPGHRDPRGPKAGSVELRLVAGPLANASIAARLCAALARRRPGLPAGGVRRAEAGAAVDDCAYSRHRGLDQPRPVGRARPGSHRR